MSKAKASPHLGRRQRRLRGGPAGLLDEIGWAVRRSPVSRPQMTARSNPEYITKVSTPN
jgi:hypothetical protein